MLGFASLLGGGGGGGMGLSMSDQQSSESKLSSGNFLGGSVNLGSPKNAWITPAIIGVVAVVGVLLLKKK